MNDKRLERALLSLKGLAVGDSLGGFFEGMRSSFILRFAKSRELPPAPWPFTDDTNMALSIVSVLRQYGEIDQGLLARSFADRLEPRGYGPSTRRILARIQKGGDWRDLSRGAFNGTGSYGNGGAMRAAPIGAYFADDMEKVVEQAALSAEITHAHIDGIAGAIAIAAGAAVAWNVRESLPDRRNFIEAVLPHVPGGFVKTEIERALDLPMGTSVKEAARQLGNGSRVTAQDTVPFVLWSAGESLGDFEEAIWRTIRGGGDVDTTCAMVGGIAAMTCSPDEIPAEWLTCCEPLPDWHLKETS